MLNEDILSKDQTQNEVKEIEDVNLGETTIQEDLAKIQDIINNNLSNPTKEQLKSKKKLDRTIDELLLNLSQSGHKSHLELLTKRKIPKGTEARVVHSYNPKNIIQDSSSTISYGSLDKFDE